MQHRGMHGRQEIAVSSSLCSFPRWKEPNLPAVEFLANDRQAGITATLHSGLLLHFLLFPMSRDVPVKRKQIVHRLAESKRPACRSPAVEAMAGRKHNFCEKFSFDRHCQSHFIHSPKENEAKNWRFAVFPIFCLLLLRKSTSSLQLD